MMLTMDIISFVCGNLCVQTSGLCFSRDPCLSPEDALSMRLVVCRIEYSSRSVLDSAGYTCDCACVHEWCCPNIQCTLLLTASLLKASPFGDALLDTNHDLYACLHTAEWGSFLLQQHVKASSCCRFCCTVCYVRQCNASTSCRACADAGV